MIIRFKEIFHSIRRKNKGNKEKKGLGREAHILKRMKSSLFIRKNIVK